MSAKYEVVIEAEPAENDMAIIIGGLTAYNAVHANGDVPDYLLIILRGADGAITGGVVGATYLGWLQIMALWLPDELRGLGYGAALLAAAEGEGVRRGCPRVFLETLSFQALPFYEKHGYRIVTRLPGFPPGGCRYGLTKELRTSDAESQLTA